MTTDPARGKRIAALRKETGRTQKALATAVGVGERTFQLWEQGRPISEPNLASLAYELGVAPEVILYADPLPPRGDDDTERVPYVDQIGLLERRVRRHEAELAHLASIADRITRLEGELRSLRESVDALVAAFAQLQLMIPQPSSSTGNSEGEASRRSRPGGA